MSETAPPKREGGVTGKGFKKGRSGNPNGRPKWLGDLRALCREHTEEAVKTALKIMRDPKATPAAKMAVVTFIIENGHGKAPQTIDMNLGGGLLGALAGIRRSRGNGAAAGVGNGSGPVRAGSPANGAGALANGSAANGSGPRPGSH